MTTRKALIGNNVILPDGRTGKVTGIDSQTLIARVVIGNGQYVDVSQDDLQMIQRKGGAE